MGTSNMSITNIECYLSFNKKKEDTFGTCGVVLVHDSNEMFTDFTVYEDGLMVDGMIKQLLKAMAYLHNNFAAGVAMFVKLHHRNPAIHTVLTKAEKGYHLIKTVESEVSTNFILTQFFTRKDYHKPKSFDLMVKVAKGLRQANEKQQFVMFIGRDSNSYMAQRTFYECRGVQQTVGQEEESTNVIEFPSPLKRENKNETN
jgi:hypothetical protein